MDIGELVNECETLHQIFVKAQADKIKLHIVELRTGDNGFSVLSAKKDYALVTVAADSFDESIRSTTCIHPYGSSIGYTTEPSY